ncbi:nuclear transport factor 2 family protein [Bradyrhizobium sp. INPA01-394B]|uniref:Nuclear transport factor 2 family protein n=1 Tax=Bradyrhizobium campsiandrae TaxID=1729892 RepID=A0ABR7UBV9_9BRAD|nr:nuclear transport factor 2 family protein [Bradyrhizobium campsiandrae]MBC9880518.1 nuclear transport factor 2 family protein [Bradyrhizobium campsiandrae]MBC9981001.1 nuclear transport factor 2 family protein [Bradyrhizobium campsiandrae]
MSNEVRDLFDRWERVWHERDYDLVPGCLGPNYIRHDENGDRTVTREAYAAELKSVHEARPGIRVVVYDHAFTGDRAWFRFSFQWSDPETGQKQSRAGMQSYRIEDGKLVETWITMRPLGTSWADVAQERWTSGKIAAIGG